MLSSTTVTVWPPRGLQLALRGSEPGGNCRKGCSWPETEEGSSRKRRREEEKKESRRSRSSSAPAEGAPPLRLWPGRARRMGVGEELRGARRSEVKARVLL